MNELMIFETNQVEVFELDGTIYFNPYHVGNCLDLKPSAIRKAIRNMNNGQVVKLKNSDVKKGNIRKLNNAGENFLTESGVYKLVFRSNKPKAEKFTDWVTDEVLPAIRKEGAYIKPSKKIQTISNYSNKEKLYNINVAVKRIIPVLEKAGVSPQLQAKTLKELYDKAGIELAIESETDNKLLEKKIYMLELLFEKCKTQKDRQFLLEGLPQSNLPLRLQSYLMTMIDNIKLS